MHISRCVFFFVSSIDLGDRFFLRNKSHDAGRFLLYLVIEASGGIGSPGHRADTVGDIGTFEIVSIHGDRLVVVGILLIFHQHQFIIDLQRKQACLFIKVIRCAVRPLCLTSVHLTYNHPFMEPIALRSRTLAACIFENTPKGTLLPFGITASACLDLNQGPLHYQCSALTN